MRSKGRNIIVVGTSAGGLEALDELIGQLPTDLAASLFIVQHLAPPNSGAALMRRLSRHKAFAVTLAKDGERFRPGRIYIAPPDHHLLLKTDRMLVRKGARENRSRPAADPLFRSAAVAHGSRLIGVILTGMLDDGTAGLMAIKRCGGVSVVQDPKDAAYSGMPQSALDNLKVDFCVPIAEMGRLLPTLVAKPHGKTTAIPRDIRTEALVLLAVATVSGQARITPPYNSYTPAQDTQVGRQAAAQVERQLPIMRDDEVSSYVEGVGRRLVAAIPTELRYPEFQYTFNAVNVREINAFALPGGPMFINRGMIEAVW
jgi:CheB methylesterase